MQTFKSYLLEQFSVLVPNFMLLENRLEFLRKTYPELDTSHDTNGNHKEAADIIQHFADNADPSKNKAHTQWIIGQYKKKNIRQEDSHRIFQGLSEFDKHKAKLEHKDIGKYKTLGALEDAVEPHRGTAATKKEEVRNIKSEGADKKYEDDNISIHHLKTREAAKHYGKGTKWCTAAEDDDHNMFDHYHAQGPMHVIMDKKNKSESGHQRKYQFHAASNQFMNERDEPISKEEFESIKPSFHKAIDMHPAMVGADEL